MRNNTDKPMHDPEHPDDPLLPGHVRLYEFLHNYEDITFAEEARRHALWANDPLAQILDQEIQKAIDADVIATICKNAVAK